MPLGSVDPVRGVIYLLAFSYLVFRTYMSLCRLDNWQIASTSDTRDSDVLAFPSITVCPMPMTDLLDSGFNLTRHLEEATLSVEDIVLSLEHHYIENGNDTITVHLSSSSNNTLPPDALHKSIGPTEHYRKLKTCLTYDPMGPSKSGFQRDKAFILSINTSVIKAWGVIMHEKHHFVHNAIGLYKSAYTYTLLTSAQNDIVTGKVIDVQATHASYINDEKSICKSEPLNESIDHCVQKYIVKEIGCKLTWLKNDSAESGSNLDQCNTAQYEEYQRLYYEIVASSENTISTRTGCMPSCKRNEFRSTVLDTFTYPDSSAPALKFQIFFPSNRFDEKVYYYTYEWGGFIADVGGYMGLLLGHSAISFYDGLKRFWKNKGKKWVIDHK